MSKEFPTKKLRLRSSDDGMGNRRSDPTVYAGDRGAQTVRATDPLLQAQRIAIRCLPSFDFMALVSRLQFVYKLSVSAGRWTMGHFGVSARS